MQDYDFFKDAYIRNKDKLFRELFMAGYDGISDFIGYDYPGDEDKDVTEARMEAALEHLCDDELFDAFKKYGLMHHFVGMIAGKYVRDAQVYEHSIPPEKYSDWDECEDYWNDTSGHALAVYDHAAVDAEQVEKQLRNLYACPDDAFIILQVVD